MNCIFSLSSALSLPRSTLGLSLLFSVSLSHFRETAMEIQAVLGAQACLVPQACQANGEKR